MKKIILLGCTIFLCFTLFAQDSTTHRDSKAERRNEKRQRINIISRQEEEGVLSYNKQSAFGIELRTNGYGIFYEHAHMLTPRFSSLYAIELAEIKDNKEERIRGDFFSNSYLFGKINNFYQLNLGYGQQYVFGEKGNKNGVAITGIYQAGLSLGVLKPYYLQVVDSANQSRDIKYQSDDSNLFLDPSSIYGSSGLGKGWSELSFKPGAYAKAALRFDFGHYNESLEALEIGISVDGYASKIPIMALNPAKNFFYQAHIALVFGRRK